jgi:hypothetical protein
MRDQIVVACARRRVWEVFELMCVLLPHPRRLGAGTRRHGLLLLPLDAHGIRGDGMVGHHIRKRAGRAVQAGGINNVIKAKP